MRVKRHGLGFMPQWQARGIDVTGASCRLLAKTIEGQEDPQVSRKLVGGDSRVKVAAGCLPGGHTAFSTACCGLVTPGSAATTNPEPIISYRHRGQCQEVLVWEGVN